MSSISGGELNRYFHSDSSNHTGGQWQSSDSSSSQHTFNPTPPNYWHPSPTTHQIPDHSHHHFSTTSWPFDVGAANDLLQRIVDELAETDTPFEAITVTIGVMSAKLSEYLGAELDEPSYDAWTECPKCKRREILKDDYVCTSCRYG